MNDYRKTFEKLVALPNASFCAKNAGDAGTALTVEWILAGGQRTAASFMGSGGYAPLEQVLAALKTSGYPLPNIDLSYLRQAAKAWERLTDESVATHQPVLGSRLFDVESGVHVDGIIKNNRCYEPFEPEQVGAQRRIIIGKHTGKRALALKLKELGLDVRADLDRLLELVREAAMEQGGSLDDSAFAALAERVKGDDAA
jgi:homocitrate synthase NifV